MFVSADRNQEGHVNYCSSEEDGETRRSRIDVGGKGKLDLVAQVTELGDSRDSGGGDIGNWIGETGATC